MNRPKRSSAVALFLLAMAALLIATGCGGGGGAMNSSTPPTTTTTTPGTAQASVNIGDAPAGRVLAFEVTVTSVVLTRTDNSTATVFAGSRRLEVTHLSGTFEPLALGSIPSGTYTKADITVTDPEVVFLDATNKIQTWEDKTFNKTVSIAFSPSLVVGTTPLVLNFDLNAASSIVLDPAAGTVTINPTFTINPVTMAANQPREPENGEFEHIVGTVTSVNVAANQFSIIIGQSATPITFTTNSSTKFEIGDTVTGGLASLANGMLVRVEGMMQSDGTPLATEVEAFVVTTTGSEAEGIVTATTGNPVTQFSMVAQDGSGSGMGASAAITGQTITVNVASNSKFDVDASGLTIDSAVFPFDAMRFTQGQRVEADSESALQPGQPSGPAGVILAKKIKLEQQALVGTLSNFSGS
ncbi:MAG: DUF5666 domain-containing protein, partial [Betaproteobacteria bacterium]